ncbi:glycosyl transferase [Psychromonas marina]|uniref:Glycosyl transferase n=1 Tax=Psychromonas marina TaxID=88364 RepID=A0ABQ6E282_9GAMM|nr:glycosyltransferase [Psychromonas marina]GLS91288.1 glycosyl transferase [Psychromonas marina]
MKTIIQVVQHLRPGGIETLVLDLLAFSQADETTIIVSLEGELESAIEAWPKLAPYRDRLIFVNKTPGLTPSLIFTLAKLFKKLNAHAIHTHHIGPLLYAGFAARLSSIKHLIHTEHDAWHLNDKKRCLLQRFVIKAVRPTLVADAKTVANQMQLKLQCANKINVIHNGINSQLFIPGDQCLARQGLNLPQHVTLIGCSGRMEVVKGQSVLLHALTALPDNIHLAFAGGGSTEQQLQALALKLGINKRVHFLGRLDNMPIFYQALDIFCLPSLNEGFPLSPLEAQSCNIKTLVTDVGASKETLCPESGQFVIADNAQEMARTLLSMLQDHKTYQPREFVKQHGEVRTMAQAYASLRFVGNNKAAILGDSRL